MKDVNKMSVDELGAAITEMSRKKDEYLVKFKDEIAPLIRRRDQLLAEQSAQAKLDGMNDDEKKALHRIISISGGIDSKAALGKPGSGGR